MVKRIKADRFEAFLDEFRPIADKDSDYVRPWAAYQIMASMHFARIFRVVRERRERQARHPKSCSPCADAAWAHQAYGRKGKNRWRVKR